MYKERGMRGSKSEVLDRKRVNEVHENRASHSMSHTVNGKGKAASNSVTIGKQLHDQKNRDSRSASLSKATIFEEHQIIMEKEYMCKFCNKKFPSGKSLGGHIRIHTNMKTTIKCCWLQVVIFKQPAVVCCSVKAMPVFTFANQAGLDMLETTLVALQDISLEKIFDENGSLL